MDSSGSGVLMVTVEVTSERSSLKAGISISGGEGGGSGYPDEGSSICDTSCSREVASLFVLLLGCEIFGFFFSKKPHNCKFYHSKIEK